MSRKINQGAKVDTMEFHNAQTADGKLIITDINVQLPEPLVHGSCANVKSLQRKAVMLYRNNRLQAIRIIPRENSQVGEVYIGKIKNITSHPEACFVEIGGKQTCFLPLSEAKSPFILNRQGTDKLKPGDELLVQITKDAQKNKLCTCSTRISLVTNYVAFTGSAAKHDMEDKAVACESLEKISYSGKLSPTKKQEFQSYLKLHGADLQNELLQLKQTMCLQLPMLDMVIRTKAEECTPEQVFRDLSATYREYLSMLQTAATRTCFTCIRSMPRTYEQLLQEVALPEEYCEIVTDNREIYGSLSETPLFQTNPVHTLRFYEDSLLSLNRLYGLDAKVEEALGRRIWLKSGANLIIEPTEAMTVIDVNSAKKDAYKAGLDEASQINREAATEIALQLRLRNLSGIIIVDFINMKDKELEKSLLTHLKEAVSSDPVKTKVIDMTPLGLAEITRKKVHKPLAEQILS